ncbi:hypothetical protein Sme01_40590 [Sphaerisporangium melleum]|uniref:Transmembrane protein n=1 Tax=Sphaerisporangium melleum TaxID=321316 RepID=A0A917RC41_9ACTN|nr:hypothetical protein GCM10007964_48390 [Sphaerisporangium melleum]GII71583.1 hypothetical protein Sme01_40590 [Sphaerisporangium melleum]
MRRRSDRVEGVAVLITLLALLLCLWPAALAAGAVYQRGATAEREEPAQRRQVTAVLIEDATSTSTVSSQGAILGTKAKVRWYGPDRREHTQVMAVPAQSKAGSTLELWIDSADHPVAAPRTHAQTLADTIVAGFGVMAAAGGVLFLNLTLVRWLLDRRRYAEWDAEWAGVHQRWRRPRQP